MLEAGCWVLDVRVLSSIQHPVSSIRMSELYEPVLHVVLYQPEIPYNAGSVGRTCVAVGAKLWLVRPLGFRVDDYYLRRAGLDYWERLVWEAVDDWQALLTALPSGRRWLFTKKASRSYLDVSYEPGDVFIFGSESAGLPDSILETDQEAQLRIPTRPDVRSLNLSNSVAVAAYEVIRQWRRPA
jgi:tRNA (cytidine/uridine-2'-O-)-methyltransferase